MQLDNLKLRGIRIRMKKENLLFHENEQEGEFNGITLKTRLGTNTREQRVKPIFPIFIFFI